MAYDFADGGTTVIDCGDPTTLRVGTGDMSMGCWIDADVIDYAGDAGYILTKWNGSAGPIMYLYTSQLNGAAATALFGAVAITTGVHHIAIVRSGTGVTLYLDGASAATTTDAGNGDAATENFGIGKRVGSAAGSTNFDGRISEVFFYKGIALTAAQIASIAKGFSPSLVLKGTHYWPLVRETVDLWGAQTATVTAATVAAHPRVIYPRRRPINPFVTAVVGGATVGVGLTRSLRLERLKRAA